MSFAFDFIVLRNRIFMQMSGKDLTIIRKLTHSQGYIHLLPITIKYSLSLLNINFVFISRLLLIEVNLIAIICN